MNGTQTPGLQLPRCCAHLVSWDDRPRTDLAYAVADTRDRGAEDRQQATGTEAAVPTPHGADTSCRGGESGGERGVFAEQLAVL
ncbi:hypothetical protein [Streptomyces sp. NPDC058307]|uniref:hypothetical protein n=1 Tax=Streptomyces sp. NPDC058307 TaxID=3346439 RepID=UPI0036E7B8A2